LRHVTAPSSPLSYRERLTFKCSWFADPSRNPSSVETLSFIYPLEFSLSLYPDTWLILTSSDCQRAFTTVKLMFDQPLIDWGNKIVEPFSSDNPPKW
jgi:hypothetical protein